MAAEQNYTLCETAHQQRQHSCTTDYRHCCVSGCTSRAKNNPEKRLSFHKFPRDDYMRKKWVESLMDRCGDEGPWTLFKVTESMHVCSEHFQPSELRWLATGERRRLVKDAIPSVFPSACSHREQTAQGTTSPPLMKETDGFRRVGGMASDNPWSAKSADMLKTAADVGREPETWTFSPSEGTKLVWPDQTRTTAIAGMATFTNPLAVFFKSDTGEITSTNPLAVFFKSDTGETTSTNPSAVVFKSDTGEATVTNPSAIVFNEAASANPSFLASKAEPGDEATMESEPTVGADGVQNEEAELVNHTAEPVNQINIDSRLLERSLPRAVEKGDIRERAECEICTCGDNVNCDEGAELLGTNCRERTARELCTCADYVNIDMYTELFRANVRKRTVCEPCTCGDHINSVVFTDQSSGRERTERGPCTCGDHINSVVFTEQSSGRERTERGPCTCGDYVSSVVCTEPFRVNGRGITAWEPRTCGDRVNYARTQPQTHTVGAPVPVHVNTGGSDVKNELVGADDSWGMKTEAFRNDSSSHRCYSSDCFQTAAETVDSSSEVQLAGVGGLRVPVDKTEPCSDGEKTELRRAALHPGNNVLTGSATDVDNIGVRLAGTGTVKNEPAVNSGGHIMLEHLQIHCICDGRFEAFTANTSVDSGTAPFSFEDPTEAVRTITNNQGIQDTQVIQDSHSAQASPNRDLNTYCIRTSSSDQASTSDDLNTEHLRSCSSVEAILNDGLNTEFLTPCSSVQASLNDGLTTKYIRPCSSDEASPSDDLNTASLKTSSNDQATLNDDDLNTEDIRSCSSDEASSNNDFNTEFLRPCSSEDKEGTNDGLNTEDIRTCSSDEASSNDGFNAEFLTAYSSDDETSTHDGLNTEFLPTSSPNDDHAQRVTANTWRSKGSEALWDWMKIVMRDASNSESISSIRESSSGQPGAQ